MAAHGPPSARRGGFIWLTGIAWLIFGCSALFSGCVTHSGYEFAYQQTCGPNPPTEWRLQCTFIGLGVSSLCLVPALVLLIRGHRIGTAVALLLGFFSMAASVIGWLLPVLASALC
jgi:hypothetical protein